jgi:valyl-tRNA synthetase
LPVEVEVEKERKVSMRSVSREEFLKVCREFLDEVEKELVKVARRLGMSCDLEHYYRTDSPEYRLLTQATFIELWKKGLIYEGFRPTNWCPVCRTTIADAEVEYREDDAQLCYIRFERKGGGDLIVATTRPELLGSCKALIFNPEDERYADLEGSRAKVPIYQHVVPILSHPYAKPEFGTGLAMICSYGDYADIRLFKELNLEPLMLINADGRMNSNAGPYAGLTVEEARRRILEDLKDGGLLTKVETIKHRVPICWRSKNPIEFIFMEEYYLKQFEFLDELRKVVNEIEFYPPESKQVLMNWMNSISSDWPISRRRFYGTEVPVWYCARCGKSYLSGPDRYYQPWKEGCPVERCECGSTEFRGDDRTLDTWMDSSLTQLYILRYKRNEDLFDKAFPCSLRPQGVDIVRSWLYYSILRTYQLLGKPAFEKVRVSGMGLDEKGEAMHKSKGNVIYPEPFLREYGADAFRLWGAMEAKLGADYRFSRERLAGTFKFLTKLWNIARFISAFPYVKEDFELAYSDRMILAELNRLIATCQEGYDQMDFFLPATAIRRFAWSVFADHYLECVKARAYNGGRGYSSEAQRGAWYTLHACLETLLKLLAPICPFITDALWRELYGRESIHLQPFPKERAEWKDEEAGRLLEPFIRFNSAIWKYKKRRRISLRTPVKRACGPASLAPLKADLQAMHEIDELTFGEPPAGLVKLEEGIYVGD